RQFLLGEHAAVGLAHHHPAQSSGLSDQRLPLEFLRNRRCQRRPQPGHDARLPRRMHGHGVVDIPDRVPTEELTLPRRCTATREKVSAVHQGRIPTPLEPKPDSGHSVCRGDGEPRRHQPGGQKYMRSFLVALAGLLIATSAQAKVAITVDKDNQQMTVEVDGVARYRWPVSSGLPTYETPNGSFRTFRREAYHYSKEFYDATMPHSIFFTKIGHAIHGTDSVSKLGSPASHGCVRLSRANAATLYALVQDQGVLNTTVTLTGSSQVALARNPRGRANTAVARRDYEQQQQCGSAGEPTVITRQSGYAPQPQPGYAPQPQLGHAPQQQVRRDDGYIYPADGSSTDQIYPAPRPRAQVYPPQQQYYYQDRGYAPAPQGYYNQPR